MNCRITEIRNCNKILLQGSIKVNFSMIKIILFCKHRPHWPWLYPKTSKITNFGDLGDQDLIKPHHRTRATRWACTLQVPIRTGFHYLPRANPTRKLIVDKFFYNVARIVWAWGRAIILSMIPSGEPKNNVIGLFASPF